MVGDRGQVAAAAGVGEQHRRAARAEFLCRVAYADPGAVGTAEREDGEALADDGHRSVAHLGGAERSEEHTSELQSLMRNSYAVFCLKKKKKNDRITSKVTSKDNY